MPSRKAHKLTQYKECKAAGLDEEACYKKVSCTYKWIIHHAWVSSLYAVTLVLYIQISMMMDEFFGLRSFMWPTFAGNGFDFQPPK